MPVKRPWLDFNEALFMCAFSVSACPFAWSRVQVAVSVKYYTLWQKRKLFELGDPRTFFHFILESSLLQLQLLWKHYLNNDVLYCISFFYQIHPFKCEGQTLSDQDSTASGCLESNLVQHGNSETLKCTVGSAEKGSYWSGIGNWPQY